LDMYEIIVSFPEPFNPMAPITNIYFPSFGELVVNVLNIFP
jgi:hypothetical protein